MPVLVHLTDGKDAYKIRGDGLRGLPACFPGERPSDTVTLAQAVFAMPHLPNELATHQWITELVRRGYASIVAVHFELDHHARVWVGRERREHLHVRLCDAVDRMKRERDLRGWEIIIPGDVPASAIRELRQLRQLRKHLPPHGPLDPCETGSHHPERLSPPLEPRLPI